jgi:hypothetical protein
MIRIFILAAALGLLGGGKGGSSGGGLCGFCAKGRCSWKKPCGNMNCSCMCMDS